MNHLTRILLAFLFACSLNAKKAEQHESASSRLWKEFKYDVSLAKTQWWPNLGESRWNHIAPYQLYLGAIPLKPAHLTQIKALGVNRILSVVENFELEPSLVATPVTRKEWEDNGVEVEQIPAEDFEGLTIAELDEGTRYLHGQLGAGNTVYVHCKAGRGRSAGMIVGYLMRYHSYTFDRAYDFVKAQRPQIHFNASQRAALFVFEKTIVSASGPLR